jgi:hypothetical protein
MKFLFLLWIAMVGIFDASIWATAAWCVLYSFSTVSWLQCFWISLAIRFIGSLSFVKYIRTHTREDCFSYIRRESKLIGLSIISAPFLSILPTVGAILLLSLLQVWTNLETHWLHAWLLVTCLVYNLCRMREARKKALQANNQLFQRSGSIWKLRSDPGDHIGAEDEVGQPHREDRPGSRKSPAKVAGSSRKAARGPRSMRVIDV